MSKSPRIIVTVDFAGDARPEGYIVEIKPEAGNAVGSWGGSGNIDAGNQIMFRDIPPGRYVIQGRPNPFCAKQPQPSRLRSSSKAARQAGSRCPRGAESFFGRSPQHFRR